MTNNVHTMKRGALAGALILLAIMEAAARGLRGSGEIKLLPPVTQKESADVDSPPASFGFYDGGNKAVDAAGAQSPPASFGFFDGGNKQTQDEEAPASHGFYLGGNKEQQEAPPAPYGFYNGGDKEMEVSSPLADDVAVKNP